MLGRLTLLVHLGNAGIETAVIGATQSDLGSEPFQFIEWNDPGGRAVRRMLSLESTVRKARLSPKVVAGMDLFAMRSAIRIKKKIVSQARVRHA